MNPNLPPAVWLVIWLGSTAVCCTLVAWLFFQLGWDHCDREQYLARHKRDTGPAAELPGPPGLPVAGQLDPFPGDDEDWSFFGGAQVEPQPGAAEYRLMTEQAADRAAETCEMCESRTGETADEFIARQDREMTELIGRMEAETDRLLDAMRDQP
jgi:hypothetical protein